MRVLVMLVLSVGLLGVADAKPLKQPPGRVTLSPLVVKDGPTHDYEPIERVLQSRIPLWRACYSKELKSAPNLAGKIVAAFAIEHDGRVGKARVVKSSVKPVDKCLLYHLRRLTFPVGVIADVEQTFTFIPRD